MLLCENLPKIKKQKKKHARKECINTKNREKQRENAEKKKERENVEKSTMYLYTISKTKLRQKRQEIHPKNITLIKRISEYNYLKYF